MDSVDRLLAQRAEQGLPEVVEDEVALAKVAALVDLPVVEVAS